MRRTPSAACVALILDRRTYSVTRSESHHRSLLGSRSLLSRGPVHSHRLGPVLPRGRLGGRAAAAVTQATQGNHYHHRASWCPTREWPNFMRACGS